MKIYESVQFSRTAERNRFARWVQRTLIVGLALGAMINFVPPLAAAEIKPQTTTKKAPSNLTGRIIFVDKALRALAIEVKGQILQISVPSHLRISRAGKIITLEELASGQEVTLSFRETVQGGLEVVSVSGEGAGGAAEV